MISLAFQLPAAVFAFRGTGWPPGTPSPAGQPEPGLLIAQLVLAVLGPLALLAVRRFPGPVVAFTAAAASLDLFVGRPETGPPYVALAFAIVISIVRGARLWAWISVATAWVATLTVAAVLGATWRPLPIALTTLGILVVLGVGEAVRSRKERFAQLSAKMAERQQTEVQAERVRIARELHDVLAHSLSQINVQAGVGLHLMDAQPDKAKDALASIKETSKTALDEVRSVLGVLRAGTGADPAAPLVPEPDLTRLPGLAASITSQGVHVYVSGTPLDAPKATQLAMYRIVQESLTNVVRHSGASEAWVEFDEGEGFHIVTIRDNGTAAAASAAQLAEEGGRGLLGMRERAELLGGTLEAGPRERGGFAVSARIPMRAKEPVE